MAALLAELVGYVLGLVARVTALQAFSGWLGRIIGQSGAPIAEGSLLQELFTTYNSVLAQGALLANATYGLAAAHTERQTILAAIAALPAGSAIPSASDTAAGVWNAIDPFRFPGDIPYGQELFQAAEWASLVRWGGSVPAKWAPFFNISYPPPAPD